MPQAVGTEVQLTYVEEVTRGTTPGTPTMKELRGSIKNINGTKAELVSDEIRSDGLQSDSRHGFNRVEGNWSSILSMQDYDDVIRYAMQATAWPAEVSVTGIDLGITDTTNVIDRASGSFVTDGFRAGDIVELTGFANSENNTQFTVLTVAALSLTVDDPDGVIITEAAGAGRTVTIPGRRIDVGTALKTVTFERGFTGVAQYQVFRGVGFRTLALSLTPDDFPRISSDFLGLSFPVATGTPLDADPTLPQNTTAFGPFDGVLYQGGVAIGVCTALNFTLGTRLSTQGVLFSKSSPDLYNGTRELTGTISVMFEDATFYNEFVNETESSVYVKIEDLNGVDFHNVVIPRLKINSAPIDPPQEGPVLFTSEFRGLRHPTTGTPLSWQKSNDEA